jgi:hypothetical protein
MRITALFLFVFVGCTSLKPLPDPTFTQERLSTQLNVEDRVWVLKKDGEDYRNLIIDSIEETYLLGHNNEADNLIIPYLSIEELKMYQFSTVKTVALIVGIPAGILIIGVISCNTGGGCFE